MFGMVLLLVWSLSSAGASAAEHSRLSVEEAERAVHAAMVHCRKDGYRVSAALVDRAGLVMALLRDDGAGPHTLDSSRRKAYTAASLGESTAKLAKLVAEHPELHGLGRMNDSILLLGGGLPIRLGGVLAGGIGVGGAPGADFDEACARAGLATLENSPEH